MTCPHCGGYSHPEGGHVGDHNVVDRIVENLRTSGDDSPGRHTQEDCLYIAVLRAIADGKAQYPRALAETALKAADLDFERWYE